MTSCARSLAGGVLLLLGGCFLNPYQADFTCPDTDKGSCVSVKTAYDASLAGTGGMKAPAGQGNETVHVVERDCVTQAPYCIEQVVEKPAPGTSDKKAGAEGTEYREALYAKMTGLLKEPATPMIAPPVALRGLIMPYRGDGNRLYQQRYVYFFVDGPRWILNEITEDEE